MNAINTYTQILTTADLVRAAQAGDRDAFGELFERFQPTVYAIAMRRLRDHADAQELCQDVFVQAMLKIEQLRTLRRSSDGFVRSPSAWPSTEPSVERTQFPLSQRCLRQL